MYFWASSVISLFWQKREVFRDLTRMYFKTTEKHSLAQGGTFCGEKQFWLIFFFFTGLIKTVVYTKSTFFFWIWLFSKLLSKTNFLSNSEILSDIVSFWLIREVFSVFPRKSFKQVGKHSLVYVAHIDEKHFFFPY